MPDTKWVSKQNLQTFWEYIKDQIEEIVSHAAVGVETTWDEYEELPEEEKMNGTIYYITDKDNEDILFASDATYDNTQSGLAATDAQGAIDEVKSEIDEVTPILEWVDLTSNILYGGIISNKNLKVKYNPLLNLLHVYGNISTNTALSAYSGTGLFQVIGDYRPMRGATSVYNTNQSKAHLVFIDENGTFKYADSAAISGAVWFYINYIGRIDT